MVMYPEKAISGFCHEDGTAAFFNQVNSMLNRDMVVVDFGAGRGVYTEDTICPYTRDLRIIRGKVSRVIGIDVDSVVAENKAIDEYRVIELDCATGLESGSVDMIITDWTFEHIADPSVIEREFFRILKPGGWICARTPNKWGYAAIGARVIPNRHHHKVLAKLQDGRQARDVFPTVYKLNTRGLVRKAFRQGKWRVIMHTFSGHPVYCWRDNEIIMRIFRKALGILPTSLGIFWHIYIQKKPDHA